MALRFRPVALRPRLSTSLPSSNIENMPNKSRQHKRRFPTTPIRKALSASQPGHSGSRSQPAHSVKDLLARAVPILSQAADQKSCQAFWREWLATHLPVELASHMSGAVERAGGLTLFADSAAWASRLRYALPELEAQLRCAAPHINEVRVRVLPRAAASGRSP